VNSLKTFTRYCFTQVTWIVLHLKVRHTTCYPSFIRVESHRVLPPPPTWRSQQPWAEGRVDTRDEDQWRHIHESHVSPRRISIVIYKKLLWGQQAHTLWEFSLRKSRGRKPSISHFHSPSQETLDSPSGISYQKLSYRFGKRKAFLSIWEKVRETSWTKEFLET